MWCPKLFKVLTSDLDNGINCTLTKFVNDIQLIGEVDTSEGTVTQQEDMNSGIMQDGKSYQNLIKFNKDKCKVLPMGKYNPGM